MSRHATIRLKRESAEFRPFERIDGTIHWQRKRKPPSTMELRLFWMTRGRGSEDVGVVESVRIDFGDSDEAAFQFELPREPYSFSGSLISVVWALELVDDGDGIALQEFTVSPDGGEVELGEVASPASEPRSGRWQQTR